MYAYKEWQVHEKKTCQNELSHRTHNSNISRNSTFSFSRISIVDKAARKRSTSSSKTASTGNLAATGTTTGHGWITGTLTSTGSLTVTVLVVPHAVSTSAANPIVTLRIPFLPLVRSLWHQAAFVSPSAAYHGRRLYLPPPVIFV